MAFTNKTKTDLFPMKAGVVSLIPLDSNGVRLWNQAYTTNAQFLVQTAITSAISTETVSNGNGQDGEYPVEEVQNVAVQTNVYDPKFHALLANVKKTDVLRPEFVQDTIIPKQAEESLTQVAQVTFESANKPVVVDGKTAWIELRDANGNQFEQVTEPTEASALTETQFMYDADLGKLTLHKSVVDYNLTCNYYKAALKGGEAYESESTPKIKMFYIVIKGEMVSASTGEPQLYQAELTRGIVSGDLPNVTTQKQKQNTITYNFKSAPTPEGVSPFYQAFAPKAQPQLP